MILKNSVFVFKGIHEKKCHYIENSDSVDRLSVKVSCYKHPVIFETDMWDYGYIDITSIKNYNILYTRKSEIVLTATNDIIIKITGRQCVPSIISNQLSGCAFTSSFILFRPKLLQYSQFIYDTVRELIIKNPNYTFTDILNEPIEYPEIVE